MNRSTILATLAIMVVPCGWSIITFADPPADTPAPAKHQTSIFDFGLEPLPNAPSEKEDKDKAEKPEPAPAAAPQDPKPAPAAPEQKPAAPERKPVAPKPVAPAPAPANPANPAPHPVPAELKGVVEAVHIDAQGVITADKIVTLGLQRTEGAHFIAEGDFYPAPEPTPFTNGQIYFHLRRLSGKKCIDLSINGMRAKRMMFGGEQIRKFSHPMKFEGIEREKWHHFKIEAGPDGMTVQFDDQKSEVKGETETGGRNDIVLGPGAKLRHLKIAIIQPGAAK